MCVNGFTSSAVELILVAILCMHLLHFIETGIK